MFHHPTIDRRPIMSRLRLRALAAAASVGFLLVLALGATTAAASPTVQSSLTLLAAKTAALPDAAGTPAQRRTLLADAKHALRVAHERPCVALADLAHYRTVLRGVVVKSDRRSVKATTRLAELGPLSLDASRLLLGGPDTKQCGGGVTPSTRKAPKITVLSSSAKGMHLRVLLPALRFGGETGGGHLWTQLSLPNTDTPSKPGTPGIPYVSPNFAIPQGAKVVLSIGATEAYSIGGVDLFPAQPEPVDGEGDLPRPDFTKPPFATKPFTIDRAAYGRDGLVPAKPAVAGLAGSYRDVRVGSLDLPAAQYDAKARRLKVIDSIDVTITFRGSRGFSDALDTPWEFQQSDAIASLVNAKAVGVSLVDKVLRRCGEEMLVITNHSTRAIADTFAAARNAAGIRTVVKETGAGAGQIGTTATDIQTYIRGQLTSLLCIHPSYITIVGDDELVPTFTATPGGIPSDLGYSLKNNTDLLPDVAVGRLLGADNTQLTTLVNKIIGYETSPPAGGFLTHATVAAQFQDDNGDGQEERTFIQFAETVRNGLVARGVTVDRVYDDSPTTTPLKFNDGTSLPASLKKPTFPWNGTAADVTTDWNAGRFMVVHRDHGYSDGWGTPAFGTSNANALTNGALLPVVLSINCSSAAYDYDETSFTQQALVNANGGAVGVFGDTRDSPSWHNSQLALGFVDALLPSVLSSEGPATAQRMGYALINGKLRLAGLASPTTDTSSRDEMYLWHYFGDPSMQMWGGGHAPFHIDPKLITAVYKFPPPLPDPPPYQVVVQIPKQFAGQPIALLRDGVVIGKGIAGRAGAVTINASFGDGSVKPGELRVAIDAQGAQPVAVNVTGIPSGLSAH